ncbi:MAG: Tfp pilus assembly protein FimT/FimU [Vicinamibacterales bacterium]
MKLSFSSVRRQDGFSLLELTFVVAIFGALSTMAMMAAASWAEHAQADGAIEQVRTALREARERAIADRRNVEIRFPNTTQIQLVRHDVVGNTESGETVLATYTLEGDMTFRLPYGVYDLSGADDLMAGTGDNGLNVGSATDQIFTSEGTFVDQAGDTLNMELFIAHGNDKLSTRALTVFGPTAFIRGYLWNGRTWTQE